MAGARAAVELGGDRHMFPSNPTLTGGRRPNNLPGAVAYPSLLAWGFGGLIKPLKNSIGGAGGVASNVTVVNLSPKPLRYCGYHAKYCGGAPSSSIAGVATTYTTWRSPSLQGPLAWASDSTPVRVTRGRLHQTKAALVLPPYSITVVSGESGVAR
jgi:hypothetical protein